MAKPKSSLNHKHRLIELIRVYQDLERTLRELKAVAGSGGHLAALKHIDVRSLIKRLSNSKRRLERKIGNTLVLETDHMKRRISRFLHQS